jgi:hypothetical protein
MLQLLAIIFFKDSNMRSKSNEFLTPFTTDFPNIVVPNICLFPSAGHTDHELVVRGETVP